MNETQTFLTVVTLEKATQPIDWVGMPVLHPTQAFTQSPPQEVDSQLCAHDLFLHFTAAIIKKKQIFVR
jgi:hypothetical protein